MTDFEITYYTLDTDHQLVPTTDVMVWGRWFEQATRDKSRIVAKTDIDGVRVSTVFIGIDHNFDGGKPHVFETMIFGGPHEGEMWRCSTWAEAEAQHKSICLKVRLNMVEDIE